MNCENNGLLITKLLWLVNFFIYLKKIIKLRKNSSFNWFTLFHVLIRPDVIWKKVSRQLYHVHFTVIHTNSRHKYIYTVHSRIYEQSSRIVGVFFMMTPSNGNIFRVTGPLCGEFNGHRWIPLTKASDAELWCLLWSIINGRVNNPEAGDLGRHRTHPYVTVMLWFGTRDLFY